MTDKEKLDAVRAEIHRLVDVRGYDREMANDLFTFMDSLPNEPVSEDLEEAARSIRDKLYLEEGKRDELGNPYFLQNTILKAVIIGAKWQEKQDQSTIELAEDHAMLAGMNKMEEQMMKNLWKPADGDDLPEYEREVVVFTQDFPNDAGIMKVAIAHRPDPKGWDGKSIATGKIEHYTPKTYDKGGWNIPNVKYWLDIDLPKLEEDCNMSKAEETST